MELAVPQDQVSLYRKRAENDAPPYGLERVPDGERIFAKPTLLCCGGRSINRHNPEHERYVNGFAKIGHAMAGYARTLGNDDAIDIVSIAYPQHEQALAHGIFAYADKRMKGENSDNALAASFARQQLFPLVEDAAGKARPLAEVKKTLRNVTVLTHSYGATFIQQAGNALADRMQDLGFSKDEIKDATSQVVVVSAGPTVPLAGGKASFTTFNVLHKSDSEVGNLHNTHEMIADMLATAHAAAPVLVDEGNNPVIRQGRRNAQEKLFGRRELVAQPLVVVPVSLKPHSETPEYAVTPGSGEYLVYQSPPLWKNGIGQMIERPTRNDYGNTRDVRSTEGSTEFSPKEHESRDHQPPSYFHYNLDKSGGLTQDGHTLRTLMSSVISRSLSNAIENQSGSGFVPLPPHEELVKLPQQVHYPVADDVNFIATMQAKGYNARVEKALWSQISTGTTSQQAQR